jgi:hypothetical protein
MPDSATAVAGCDVLPYDPARDALGKALVAPVSVDVAVTVFLRPWLTVRESLPANAVAPSYVCASAPPPMSSTGTWAAPDARLTWLPGTS